MSAQPHDVIGQAARWRDVERRHLVLLAQSQSAHTEAALSHQAHDPWWRQVLLVVRAALLSVDSAKAFECFASLATVLWGIWAVVPWSVLPSAPNYRALVQVAPPLVWGTVMIALGLLHLAALGLDRWEPDDGLPWWRTRLRLWACGVNTFAWGYITVFQVITTPEYPGVILYGLAALCGIWATLRLSVRRDPRATWL